MWKHIHADCVSAWAPDIPLTHHKETSHLQFAVGIREKPIHYTLILIYTNMIINIKPNIKL